MEQSIVDSGAERETARRPYLKPQLIRVDLVAREAVLAAGCKTNLTLTASGSMEPEIGCQAQICSADGT